MLRKTLPLILIAILVAPAAWAKPKKQKCCDGRGGLCSCQCCDGTIVSGKCGPAYKSADTGEYYYEPKVTRTDGPVSLIINGYRFDVNGVTVNGRTLVPVRGIFERLGASVDYISDTGEIVVKYGSRALVMRVGSNAARAVSTVYYMDARPVIINGTTYVPLRFITDFLGVHLDWDGYSNTVRITSGKYYREPYYYIW